MKKAVKLPVRDLPVIGESLHGYLLRLADNNGRFTATEILRLLGHSSSPNSIHLSELLGSLSSALNVDKEALSLYFQDNIFRFKGSEFYIESMHVRDLKLCTHCLRDDDFPFIRNDWSIIPVTHCNVHQSILRHECPSCSKPFQWTSEIFEKCPSCQYPWSDHIRSSEIEVPPPWQVEFESVRDNVSALDDWWAALSKSLLKVARPDDYYFDKIQRIPEGFRDTLYLLSKAYSYEIPHKEIPPKGFVAPRRLNHLESLNFHCKFDMLADKIGVPESSIIYLVESKIIKPIHESSIVRDMFFDVREAQRFVKSIKALASKGEKQSLITPDSKLLKLNKINYGKLISFSIQNNIEIHRIKNENLSSILINTYDLSWAIKNLLSEVLCDLVSRNSAATILLVQNKAIGELVSQGLLSCPRHSANCHKIKGSSIATFLEGTHPIASKRKTYLSSLLNTK